MAIGELGAVIGGVVFLCVLGYFVYKFSLKR